MKNFGIVDIKGGLANQIFQLSFANYLKTLGLHVYLDISFFSSNHPFPRDLEIDLDKFGYKQIKLKNNLLFRILNSTFFEDDTFSSSEFKKFNRFVGYYQNLKYIDLAKTELMKKLDLYSNREQVNLAAIHIRKTDYSIIDQELKNSYYEKAIYQLLTINKNLKFDIFTDDENIVLDENIFKNTNKIYTPIIDQNSTEVLKAMINYKYYIIANSSFSAIAAFLSTLNDKVVFYPDPWWRNSAVKLTGIPSSWIKVKNL